MVRESQDVNTPPVGQPWATGSLGFPRETGSRGVRAARAVECAILVGLPGSGKSTFYHARLASTHAHVSKDAMPNVRRRNERQQQLIDAALGSGHSVAVDNTNATVAVRAPVIQQAKAHGAHIAGYFFDAPVGDCLGRNRRREGGTRVPDVAIFTFAKTLVAPSYEEGFDVIFRVRTLGGQAFRVTRVRRRADDSTPPESKTQ